MLVGEQKTAHAQVKVLDSKHNRLLHNCINGVPALVLDCNRSIDFQTDLEAQEELARQVQAYFQFVQALQKYNHRSRLITLRCVLPFFSPCQAFVFADVCHGFSWVLYGFSGYCTKLDAFQGTMPQAGVKHGRPLPPAPPTDLPDKPYLTDVVQVRLSETRQGYVPPLLACGPCVVYQWQHACLSFTRCVDRCTWGAAPVFSSTPGCSCC